MIAHEFAPPVSPFIKIIEGQDAWQWVVFAQLNVVSEGGRHRGPKCGVLVIIHIGGQVDEVWLRGDRFRFWATELGDDDAGKQADTCCV